MRHFFLSLAAASAALLCGIGTAHAVPAKPGLIQVTQSDGTQLTVRLVGDERRHYMLSSDGYTLTGGPDGDLYYAELSASGKLIPTKVKARPVNALTADEKAVVSRLGKELKPTYVKPMVMPAPQQTQAPVLPAAGKPAPPRRITSAQTTGRLKSLIILVESSDKKFASASAQQDFRNLLMQDGYSVNGATGSAWNYYQDNSNRLFDPEFVVVGPYKASKTSAYYAGSEGSDNVPELIVEACRLADNDVNFTDFADNGVIRDVFVFYAGRGQADSGDTQSIWPHRWDVRVNSKYLDVRFDGVQLQGYACGAELNGGYQMTAIGTFCHEFGHVLGWPDFYDTDYSASGGTAPALESFSLMCSGSYNNNSRTPPSVNILERWMVGWAEPEEVTENGLYTLAPVSENKGYLVQTPTTNDYFLLENRDTRNNKWDQPLNSAAACRGLLVYHVDYTSRYVPQWSYNTLNNNPAHECMKLVRSVPGRSSYDVPQKTFFPGANNITSLSPETNADYISWNSGKPSVSFSDIKLDGSQVRLSVKSKANLKAEVSARQYDALLTWEGDPAAEWEITWKSAGIQRSETVTGCNAFHITGLSPATEYALSIAQVSDTVDSSKDLIFNTEPTYTYKSVRICVPDEGYTHDTPVMLSLLDYRGKIGRIDWYIDNRKTENTYTTLAAGEHTIMAGRHRRRRGVAAVYRQIHHRQIASAMKHLKYLLLICLAAAAACSKDKTEDPTLKAQRTALQETQTVGIYRSGEALRLFDKAKQQLFVDPTTLTFRIQDDAGLKFVSLQLESMPSEGQKVRGTFTDNTGLNIGGIEDFVLLKSDKQHYWFWSDQTRVGFVFPRIGM